MIRKLKKGNILKEEFEDLITHNSLSFSKQGISIVYAPNGVGKTTISRIFNGEAGTEVIVDFDGKTYNSSDVKELFHVINDQISRNVISGTTDEYVLGENIENERKKIR